MGIRIAESGDNITNEPYPRSTSKNKAEPTAVRVASGRLGGNMVEYMRKTWVGSGNDGSTAIAWC